ncbi:hypothetical protein F4823DRAFT_465437 [Ustulina deusta]|nr:hypothetical protein F4823DRAFT_465437 [Ustulina deusta]
MLEAMWGCLGEFLRWLFWGLAKALAYVPRKLWEILASVFDSLGHGGQEVMIWINPKRPRLPRILHASNTTYKTTRPPIPPCDPACARAMLDNFSYLTLHRSITQRNHAALKTSCLARIEGEAFSVVAVSFEWD